MSKKHKRKKRPAKLQQIPTQILLTLPVVRMLKDALRLVEVSLLRNVKPLPNPELAAETLEGLKVKLDDMLQREEWDRETPLDYNELYILYAAIHMYLVDLSISKDSSMVTPCLLLCKELSRLVEQMKGSHSHKVI